MTIAPSSRRLTAIRGVRAGAILSAISARHNRLAKWLVPLIYLGCAAAFTADLFSDNTLAFGVFYTPLVVTAFFHRDSRAVWVLTLIACVLVVVGSFLPVIPRHVLELIENRTLSICAILATAAVVRHARAVQDQLADETDRAEAAERIKTEVLTNLSQEIRAPLYSMIGVIDLVAASGESGQKSALGMVRTAGRRLLTTVDNLVDLTQFDGKAVPGEPIDLGSLLRETAEASRTDAEARQINLTIDLSGSTDTVVHANPWAARRILENLIGDAITYTAPGGWIAVRTAREAGFVLAVITDTGIRPPGMLQLADDPNIDRLMPSVMGLALSRRLARAMQGRLEFSQGSGQETVAYLCLPAAQGSGLAIIQQDQAAQ